MYLGKQRRGGIAVYQASTPEHATRALVVQRELRRAMDRDELMLHYQPRLRLSTGQVTCLEALVRWQHPERGLLLPSEFLSVAERSELIKPLTSWVLRHALADCRAWTADGHQWPVSVNVSTRNLTSPEFVGSVGQILQQTGIPPDRLHLEVSEAALALDAEVTRAVIGALAGLGVSISIDHFGLGLPDLAQMDPANVSEIKIDRTFLADLPGNEQDRAFVRSVVGLGHSLGCLVTAQGVESREVADALEDAGCDEALGYLWMYPGPWTEVARVFGDQTAATSR
jgi:EAL domain-containing protein (putative c-di-GMP-specific phosphodiesterase class I)